MKKAIAHQAIAFFVVLKIRFPLVSSSRAQPRDLSCTAAICTHASSLKRRLGASLYRLSLTHVLPVCKKDPSTSALMTRKKDGSSHIVFHTMSALSAPAGHLPLEWKATIRESPLLKRRRATLVNPSAPPLRHPERSRGIFLALRLASHMSLQGNDALLLLFPTSNIHRSSVCKEDFSTSLEMTIREYRYPHHQPEP